MPIATPTALQQALLQWYDQNARDLPWRRTQDPYAIWISEVLLQQTQVAQGLGYYQRFLETFPTVQHLADATLEQVFKVWEGCGYYARARNVHKAAQHMAKQGIPTNYADWLALAGVGPYTAAAVTSMAYGLPYAVVDGNVRRVLGRWYAQAEPSEIWLQQQADAVLYRAQAGRWNNAIMELGATVCKPKQPECVRCPVAANCLALASGQPTAYPAPKARAAVQVRYGVVLLVGDAEHCYLEMRPKTGILGGLWGLPVQDSPSDEPTDIQQALQALQQRLSLTPELASQLPRYLGQVQHTLTHRQLNMWVYHLALSDAMDSALGLHSTQQAALAKLDRKMLALYTSYITHADSPQATLF